MTEYVNWVDIGMTCKHCHLPLEARKDARPQTGMVLATPLFYRHRDSQLEQCPPTTHARPWDGFDAAKAYDAKVQGK